jgi:hypothetical protein
VNALQLFLDNLRMVAINGQRVAIRARNSEGVVLCRKGKSWQTSKSWTGTGFKRPFLAGPIDAAFMSSFVFVRPTGRPLHERLGQWTKDELAGAIKMWRDVFRGDAPIEDDASLSDGDTSRNLVLWGDPSSNKLIAKILPRLPLQWTAEKLVFNGHTYDARHVVPIFIFPNPLRPDRYIVLNSGMDLRGDAYGSNALQTPKLPDWAILDLDTPPGPRWPGRILEAGFFNERWQLASEGK